MTVLSTRRRTVVRPVVVWYGLSCRFGSLAATLLDTWKLVRMRVLIMHKPGYVHVLGEPGDEAKCARADV